MARLFDRVGMAVSGTPGTGTITLGSVITDATNGDLLTLAEAGAANGDVVNYVIVDGNNFEIGTGTYSTTGPTLTRGAVSSKTGGVKGTAAISLTSAAKVYVTAFGQSLPNSWRVPAGTDIVDFWSNNAKRAYLTEYGTFRVDTYEAGGSSGNPWFIANITGVGVGANQKFTFSASDNYATFTQDVILARDAAGALALRNDANPQALRVYNTWGAAGVNYERGSFGWSANVLEFKTEAGGTGALRDLKFSGSGTTFLDLSGGNGVSLQWTSNCRMFIGNDIEFRQNGSVSLRQTMDSVSIEGGRSLKSNSFENNQGTLTSGASVAWDVRAAQSAILTLGVNAALANPTNAVAGTTYILVVKQDATGSRTLSYGSAYKWPGGLAPVLSTAANAIDVLTFVYDGTNMLGVAQKAFA